MTSGERHLLIVQLRHEECNTDCEHPCKIMEKLLDEAADEIESLQSQVQSLEQERERLRERVTGLESLAHDAEDILGEIDCDDGPLDIGDWRCWYRELGLLQTTPTDKPASKSQEKRLAVQRRGEEGPGTSDGGGQ